MTQPEKTFKLKASPKNSDKIADATLVLHNKEYFLLKESGLVDSYSRDIFRRTYHGRREVVDITADGNLKGFLFGNPIDAKNYVLGTYAKHVHWVDEETGRVLV